jgi:ribosomal-protein-alanine N-acetyltransferase
LRFSIQTIIFASVTDFLSGMRFTYFPQLEHDLVLLRPIEADDIQPWFRYLAQAEVLEQTSWQVHAPDELVQHVWDRAAFTESSTLRFAVALRSNRALVGTAGFHTISSQHGTAEIAYDLAPAYWRQGIGSAVCAALVRWAHSAAFIQRVQATVLDSNLRSVAVLERCGFQREGLLRSYRKLRDRYGDFYMYAHVDRHPVQSALTLPQRTCQIAPVI